MNNDDWYTAHATHQGGRDYQEDDFGVFRNEKTGALFVIVCDGLGGHGGGDLASRAAVDCARDLWEAKGSQAHEEFLRELAAQANERILQIQKETGIKARSTMVAAIIEGGFAHVAHSGDSRMYVIHPERDTWRTKDHSLVQVMRDADEISEQEMGTHQDQGRLLQCLGMDYPKEPSITKVMLAEDHSMLLCTDGFWENLSPAEMERVFLSGIRLHDALNAALKIAVAKGGENCDNVTAVAISSETFAKKVTTKSGLPQDPHEIESNEGFESGDPATRTYQSSPGAALPAAARAVSEKESTPREFPPPAYPAMRGSPIRLRGSRKVTAFVLLGIAAAIILLAGGIALRAFRLREELRAVHSYSKELGGFHCFDHVRLRLGEYEKKLSKQSMFDPRIPDLRTGLTDLPELMPAQVRQRWLFFEGASLYDPRYEKIFLGTGDPRLIETLLKGGEFSLYPIGKDGDLTKFAREISKSLEGAPSFDFLVLETSDRDRIAEIVSGFHSGPQQGTVPPGAEGVARASGVGEAQIDPLLRAIPTAEEAKAGPASAADVPLKDDEAIDAPAIPRPGSVLPVTEQGAQERKGLFSRWLSWWNPKSESNEEPSQIP